MDIPNFKKWNPDSRHRRAWFALSVDWFRDPKVMKLSMMDRAMFVQLLAIRAASEGQLRGISVALIRRQMGIRGASVGQSILKLLNLGLIELRSSALHNITDITNNTDVEGSQVIPEFEGIEAECLSQIPPAAQRSWLKEFGRDVVERILPTAHAAWKSNQPRSPKTNQVVPLALYLRRCLEVEKRGPRGMPNRETDWGKVFAKKGAT